MIVLKKEGNLVFYVPVVDGSCFQQLQGKCLLNGEIMKNDYFRQISLKKFNYNGHEYHMAMKYWDQLKDTADFVSIDGIYQFDKKEAYLKKYTPEDDVIEIYEFKLLNSGITQFFVSGLDFHEQKLITDNMHFDFTTFINLNENSIEEIDSILSLPKSDVIKGILYKLYPELAIFYYEIYPYITLKEIENYNIDELQKLRMATEDLRVSTYYIDQLLDYLPTAENNTKVLSMLNHSRK